MELKHKNYSHFFLGLAFLISGNYFAYKAYTYIGNANFAALFGVVACLLIVSGIIFFISLTYSTFDYINKLTFIGNGNKKIIINLTFSGIWIIIVVLLSLPFLYFNNKYKSDQLTNYGTIQKIVVEKILTGGKGTSRVSFHLNSQGTSIYTELPKKHYLIGDTGIIIFSSQDPSMVTWLDDYNNK